jgi:hypothetical protein
MVGVGGSFDVAGYYGSRPGPDKVSVFDTEGRALSASRVPHYQTLGLSTSEDQGLYTYQTSSTINQETIASVSFQPNMLHGLNLMAMTYHINRYVPITEYDPAQDRIQERKAGRFQQTVYDRAYSRKQRLTAEYAWNQYNVSNDLYVMERVNGTRTFENVITWTAKLF